MNMSCLISYLQSLKWCNFPMKWFRIVNLFVKMRRVNNLVTIGLYKYQKACRDVNRQNITTYTFHLRSSHHVFPSHYQHSNIIGHSFEWVTQCFPSAPYTFTLEQVMMHTKELSNDLFKVYGCFHILLFNPINDNVL